MCFLDKNGCLNPVHPPKWQVTDPKRVLATHGHQRNPFIASSGVRSMLFLRSFREKFCIVFIRTNFPPNYVIKIRLIFFTLFSALLNHIKLLRTEIRLPVATICVFMTFLKQFSTLLRRDPSAVCRCVACNCRFRKQSLAIACRPAFRSDVGFFSYQIQTFHILYNPDKTKNLLFID